MLHIGSYALLRVSPLSRLINPRSRDISKLNVMMDPNPILPDSYHPQSIDMSRDFKHWVSPRSRTAHPVKYYVTDFGLSRRYSAEEKSPLELPIFGGDKSVPEFQNDHNTPRNPFHTDIYYMGNLARQDFLNVCAAISFHATVEAHVVALARCTRT